MASAAQLPAAACVLLLMLLPFCVPSSPSRFPSTSYGRIEGVLSRLDSQRELAATQEAAARGVLERLLPSHLSAFQFRIIPKEWCGGHSCFWIKNINNYQKSVPVILVEGTTAVEISSGLHWYLKYWCGAHISWDKTGGIQVASVPPLQLLPRVDDEGVVIKRPVPWSYYQNVVTSSYSFVWWDWKRWEKEIDWMALQGVNLPLAFTGQEAIWQKVFKEYNVSSGDLDDFFGGPAFLAWARMGNLHGWGGPLSQNWLDQQLVLQKRILSRMIELGMTPVLPAFSGNVPAVFGKIFPSANITRLGDWNTVNGDPRWCCTYLLDPADSLFVEVGEAFIKQQIKEYGDITDIYNCDTFNENSPPTSDPAYISSLGAAVYSAMSKADKNAIWLMQGWLFSSESAFWKPPQMRALVHSVPFGKMIVLDLFADVIPIWKTSSHFYGVPYVWCMLHNFGGNIEMYGILDSISSGPLDALGSENSTMVGVGMCMEGIEQNPVVYELMSEMAFRSQKVQLKDPMVEVEQTENEILSGCILLYIDAVNDSSCRNDEKEWLKIYSQRRYGKLVQEVDTAWQILYSTIYNCTDGIADHNRDFIVQFPDRGPYDLSQGSVMQQPHKKQDTRFSFRETATNMPSPHLWYSTEEVIKALKLFLDAGDELEGSLTYRYDLVDLTRQVLSKLGNQIYLDAMIAYVESDVNAFTLQSQKFIELVKDIDALLASDDNFLLGTWLESAKSLAASREETRQYEWNARTQVTMWFDNTETNQSKLRDYANKYWSGLLNSYYLPRASTYFSYLLKSLRQDKPFPLDMWRREWISYSNKWQAGEEIHPTKATGNAHTIAKGLVTKYLR